MGKPLMLIARLVMGALLGLNSLWAGYTLAVAPSELLISELQTASANSAGEEFIELYNSTPQAIDIEGWRLQYKSATGTSWSTKATLSGQIEPRDYYLLATADYLDEAAAVFGGGLAGGGGHLRLLDNSEQLVDLVGWGTADSPETEPAVAPEAGASIQRCFETGILLDSDNNFDDLKIYSEITPGSGFECLPPVSDPPPGSLSCDGVIISELLPNPAGADGGAEFIELYNPTAHIVELDGCSLQEGASGPVYTFGAGEELKAEQYRAFFSDQTDLTLPNAAGGTVYLLSPELEELHAVTYIPDLGDDAAWAWFGAEEWSATYTPTPSASNLAQPTKPCPLGQTRNKDGGRCQNLDDGPSLKPCDAGQERNPETNRCRALAGATVKLTPCKAGQERNPETNRCRRVGSATANLKPCLPTQERNRATNRCRNIGIAAGGVGGAKTVATVPTSPTSTAVVASIAGLALLYGAYEFRHDLRNRLHLIRRYFSSRQSSGP